MSGSLQKYKPSLSLFALMFVAAILFFGLEGCAAKPLWLPPTPYQLAQQLAAEKQALIHSLIHELQEGGGQVVVVGETIEIILPSDELFNPGSTNFSIYYYSLLGCVVQLMRLYETIQAEVAGYTDDEGFPARNTALSRTQAQIVANYLWSQGVDTRFMYSRGYNGKEPIANNETWQGRYDNRRIEIYFRYIPEGVVED